MTKREEYINWLTNTKENEHGEICLSGQAVKDIVELLSLEKEPHKGSGINKYVMDDDFDILEEVKKAYEQGKKDAEPHWIPCSKKMPDEHEWLGTKKFGTTISDEVYVTFENPKGERFCKHLSFQNGKLSSYDQQHIDVWYKGSKPVAWTPLPEAWRGEKE